MSVHSDLIDIDDLRGRLSGTVHAPGDPEWDAVRAGWNLAVDQNPELVAVPADSGDVETLVAAAARAGLGVSVQATGHNAAAYTSLEGLMLIKTSAMRGVEIDPERLTARVEAGALWSEVAGPAAEHGLMALQGSSHDVGVLGYALGGGVSFLGRKHGLAAERIRAIELVTADAKLRRIDGESDPDLFWALRGGGGNYGVVTAIELELLGIERIHAGGLFFPFERSREVLGAWAEWTATVPEEMTSVGRLLQFPAIPEIPEPMRGNSYALIEVFWCGEDGAEGEALLEPLRALGPIIDTVGAVNGPELLQVHMDPPEPVPYLGDHQMLERLDSNAIGRLIDAAGPGSGSVMLSFELRHMGGALGRRSADCGALGAIEGEFMTFGVGMLADPMAAPALELSLRAARHALAPVEAASHYLNFSEHPVPMESLYGEQSLRRLREIKRAHDPGALFRGNHPIDPA